MRVRDHKAEYAAIKARAQAAGLTVRGFRRARKAESTKYYSPRAQVTLKRRQATPTGRRQTKKPSTIDASKAANFGTTKERIEQRIPKLPTDKQPIAKAKLAEADNYHDLLWDNDLTWLDDYGRNHHILWYRDD